MKLIIKPTGRLKKDLKTIQKRGYNLDLLKTVIRKLSEGEILANIMIMH